MAKIRVYELAKQLNLDSKKLVELLQLGGMGINNYMSTLDEDAVEMANSILAGRNKEKPIEIEEKRVKSNIIRRRKRRNEEFSPSKKIGIESQEDNFTELKQEKPDSENIIELQEIPLSSPPIKEFEESEIEKVQENDLPEIKEAQPEEMPEEELIEEPLPIKSAQKPPLDPDKDIKEVKEIKSKPKRSKKKDMNQPAKIIKPSEGPPLKDSFVKEKIKKKQQPPLEKNFKTLNKTKGKTNAIIKEPLNKIKKKRVVKPAKVTSSFPHRKKEVYERDALYKGRKINRKGKKGAKTRVTRETHDTTKITVPKAIKRRIKIQEFVTVSELAKAMGTKSIEIMKSLMQIGGGISTQNESIDFETASILADEFGYQLELDSFKEEDFIPEIEDRPEDLEPRPPVITIMGHVDHGKTSLLDYIRHSKIIEGESGGITQHIGAYYVQTDGGDIVFLDTPGHEAFTAMRARGTKVTDLIILVVAADDGVMPQTREAINHARAASIPIVVAVNKIDKPEADPDRVKRELAELDLVPEEWGGETIFGEISAKHGQGVDELLSLLLLQAEMLEIKGNPNKLAKGTVIEANLDKSRGPVASILIKDGSLRPGDHFICGEHYGRVRAMLNNQGQKIQYAGPSMPVEIYGISGVPMAGDKFNTVKDEKIAKQIIEHRKAHSKKPEAAQRGIISLEELYDKIKEGDIKELNLILKTDVQGSVEALSESLIKQSTDEVKIKIIHFSPGAISESDVMLASASKAIIIGFGVRANPRVTDLAEKEKVDIRYYDVIYKVIQDIRLAMTGLLAPVFKENVIGRADVKEIFRVPKIGAIAGCMVTDGHIERNAKIRLLREEIIVYNGTISSLKRFKNDVKEVQSGYECGIALEGFNDIKSGDVLEVYQVEEQKAEL